MSECDIPLPPPRCCGRCLWLLERARARRRPPAVRTISVQTWCRICGRPALINMVLDYARAVRQFQLMHLQRMTHQAGSHVESGGWGTHWRFDHVLAKAFPHEYADDARKPFWPPPTYETLSEDQSIRVLHAIGEVPPMADLREPLRSRLDLVINKTPMTRAELELQGPVWSELELHQDFEVAGFTPPFVLVVRRVDGRNGTLLFQRDPPLYWAFDPDRII